MAQSLLAHLYSHIRGSQEDVATLSLQYIISQSPELCKGFNNLIGVKLHTDVSSVMKYSCQATGENQERPDMSGKDYSGRELVLCEAKFYAGLTDNQPLTYLKRLKDEDGKGLIFICPQARITSLWSKLQELCAEEDVEEVSSECIVVNGVPMAIISWAEIIFELQRIAAACVPKALSDLNQLDGYCKEMDNVAFIPFTSEELGAITARKQKRYTDIIVKTAELIHADKRFRTTKATRGSYNGGFEYKMDIDKYRVYIAYDENMWINSDSKECPFWLLIRTKNGEQDESILSMLETLPDLDIDDEVWGYAYIALEPKVNVPLDEVAEDLKEQVYHYISLI